MLPRSGKAEGLLVNPFFIQRGNTLLSQNMVDSMILNYDDDINIFTNNDKKSCDIYTRIKLYDVTIDPTADALLKNTTYTFMNMGRLGPVGKVGTPYRFKDQVSNIEIVYKKTNNPTVIVDCILTELSCPKSSTPNISCKSTIDQQKIVRSSEYVNEIIIGYILNKIFFPSLNFDINQLNRHQILKGELLSPKDTGLSVFQLGYFTDTTEQWGCNVMQKALNTLDYLCKLIEDGKIITSPLLEDDNITIKYPKIRLQQTGSTEFITDKQMFIKHMLLQVVDALELLTNEYDFFHGDLKAGNIFFTIDDQYLSVPYMSYKNNGISKGSYVESEFFSNFRIKIADYGKSSITYNNIRYYGTISTKVGMSSVAETTATTDIPAMISSDVTTSTSTIDINKEKIPIHLYNFNTGFIGLGMLRHNNCSKYKTIDLYIFLHSLFLQSEIFRSFCKSSGIEKELIVADQENLLKFIKATSSEAEKARKSVKTPTALLNGKNLMCEAFDIIRKLLANVVSAQIFESNIKRDIYITDVEIQLNKSAKQIINNYKESYDIFISKKDDHSIQANIYEYNYFPDKADIESLLSNKNLLFQYDSLLGERGAIGIPYVLKYNNHKLIIKQSSGRDGSGIQIYSNYYDQNQSMTKFKCLESRISTKLQVPKPKCINRDFPTQIIGSSEYVNEIIIGYILNKVFFPSLMDIETINSNPNEDYIKNLVSGRLLTPNDTGLSVFQIGFFQAAYNQQKQKLDPSKASFMGYNIMEKAMGTIDKLLKFIDSGEILSAPHTVGAVTYPQLKLQYGRDSSTNIIKNADKIESKYKIIEHILLQVIDALDLLTSRYDFVHGDLKTGNIFFNIDDAYLIVPYSTYDSDNDTMKETGIYSNIRIKIADYGKSSMTYNQCRYFCEETKVDMSLIQKYTNFNTNMINSIDPKIFKIGEKKYMINSYLFKIEGATNILHEMIQGIIRHIGCTSFKTIDFYIFLVSLCLQSDLFVNFCKEYKIYTNDPNNTIINKTMIDNTGMTDEMKKDLNTAHSKIYGQYLICEAFSIFRLLIEKKTQIILHIIPHQHCIRHH